jgi:hypothetical protein
LYCDAGRDRPCLMLRLGIMFCGSHREGAPRYEFVVCCAEQTCAIIC